MHDYDNYKYIGTQKIIDLSKKENELLRILIENKGSIVLTENLLNILYEKTLSIRALEQLIHRLRRKLNGEITIKTRPGFGYGI